MKIISVSLLCLSFTQFSNAMSDNKSFLPLYKNLSCESIELPAQPQIYKFGLVIYSLISTVKRGYMTYTEYYMGEYTTNIDMKMLKQDDDYVDFDVVSQPYLVKLDKNNFTAKISHAGKDYYTCK
jgi:hypothetical protein